MKPGIPDLVGSFTLSPDKPSYTAGEPVTVSVVVTNIGTGPNTVGFWVDLYLNPASAPSGNDPWYETCGLDPCVGISWYVGEELAPGESIVLTSGPGSYSPGHTIWPGWLPAGTTDIYLYVDVWNPTASDVAVEELSETNNGFERHGLTVAGPNPPLARIADAWPARTWEAAID
jgi:hypothetical protein